MSGWVDLQVNGYLGVDFSAPGLRLEQVCRVGNDLRRRGVTGFLATLVSSPEEVYRQNLSVLARACREQGDRGPLLGIHLEGPFLSPADGARGAHDPRWISQPEASRFDGWQEAAEGWIRLVTLAPERPGALSLIEYLNGQGVAVSLGHHLADLACIREAAEAGASACTHLGNGIPQYLPRHPNPLWDQLAEERLMVMVIPDGHHVPWSFLRVVLRAAGLARVVAVSDAAPPAGLSPGRFTLWGQEVVLEASGKLWNPAENHLAGSSKNLAECVEQLLSWQLASESEADLIAAENPRRLLEIHRR